jgi:hypothetical protein
MDVVKFDDLQEVDDTSGWLSFLEQVEQSKNRSHGKDCRFANPKISLCLHEEGREGTTGCLVYLLGQLLQQLNK